MGEGWLEQVCKGLQEVPWNASTSDGNLQEMRLPCPLNGECAQVIEGVDSMADDLAPWSEASVKFPRRNYQHTGEKTALPLPVLLMMD